MNKIFLTVTVMMCFGIAGAQGNANFTTNPYSGFGKMPLSNALATTLPSGVAWASNLPSVDEEVSWRVSGGTINDALKQMAQGKFNYSPLTQKKLLISGLNDQKPIPQEALREISKPKSISPETIVIVAPAPIQSQLSLTSTPPVPTHIAIESVKVFDPPAVSPLIVAPFIPTTPRTSAFVIRNDDETLSLALRRWIGSAGYQLVWEAGKDFAARETTYNALDLISAIEAVMNDTTRSNYPLHACVYDNKVIRVLQVSQGCGRTNSEEAN